MVNMIVLARLLSPEDFGLTAIVMAVYAFIELTRAFGFDTVLIQNQQADKSHYDTAWTIQVLFGIVASVTMFLISPLIASYYEDPRLVEVGRLTSIMFLTSGLINIGVVNFRKEMDFAKEFRLHATVRVLTVALTMGLAFHFRNYWALVFGSISASLFELIISYYMSKFRPSFSLKRTRELFNFSAWLMLNNVIFYLSSHSKELIIGKMMGVNYSGLLKITDELASLPMSELVASINRATYPGYAKLAHQREKLKDLYLNALGGITIIGIPASVGLALVSPSLVPVILGDKWMEIIPAIQMLSFAYAVFSINSNSMYIFQAVGKPYLPTPIFAVQLVILLTAMYLLIKKFGLMGAPMAMLMTSLLMFPCFFLALKRVLPLKLSEYLLSFYRPLFGALAMFCSTSWMMYGNPWGQPTEPSTYSVITLLSTVIIGIFSFFGYLLALWLVAGRPEGSEQNALTWIKSRLAN